MAAEPVVFVVAAAVAGLCKIRNFVVLVTGGSECVDGELVHLAFEFFVDLFQLSVIETRPEVRAFLEGEAVGGDVVGVECERLIKVGSPIGEGFAGDAEDEIEGEGLSEGAGEIGGGADYRGVVVAFERF